MNIDELTLGQIKQLQCLLGGSATRTEACCDPDVGKYVLVRAYGAGVHVGVLSARNGKEVRLTDTRRIWRWFGANTISEISLRGLDTSKSRLSESVASNTLTDVIEVIPCTPEAEKILRGAKWTA